jgi:hypothetical protein
MEPWKPSVFTPLSRRFEDQQAREIDETRTLYRILENHQAQFAETPDSVVRKVEPYVDDLPPLLREPLLTALREVTDSHRFIFEMPAFDTRCTLTEWADFRNLLRAKEYFFQNREKVLQLLHDGLVRLGCAIAEVLPKTQAPSPFTIPLVYAVPAPGSLMTGMLGLCYEPQYAERGLFRELMLALQQNVAAVSGRVLGEKSSRPIKHAEDSDLPLAELNDTYLGGTPFQALFELPVPLKFTHEDRFNHVHIVGGTGAGKTTLLENLILNDLMRNDDPPGMVIVDGQGDLLRKIAHLEVFDPDRSAYADRLIIVDPKDIEYPPALNIFDVNQKRLAQYGEVMKEQVIAGVIETFDYLFSGLLGADLTAKQGIFFKYIARLMLALPDTLGRNATILDMMRLMEDVGPYRNAIARLPELQRNFFERDFGSKTFAQTKEQIRYRLQAVLENPTIARLFTAPSTKLDLFEELNRGSIILVDTSKDFLKGASSHFGRIFVSLVLQAVQERAALAQKERRDAFLIVDEAGSYFDSNIDELLTDARKYRLGCVFAHQYLEQASPALRASLAANTGSKFASRVSSADARALAADMRTKPEFILAQPALQFACHIRDVTPEAVSIPVEVGQFEQYGTLSEERYQELRHRNRARVSLGRLGATAPPAPNEAAPMSSPPIDAAASEW